jgi:hypothetical protein
VTLRVTPFKRGILALERDPDLMNFAMFTAGRFDALVQRLAERVNARCPPVVANNPERTVSHERVEEILNECIVAALQLLREKRIGLLGRARLKSALRWELREIGYEEKFADLAAEKLIEHVSRSHG